MKNCILYLVRASKEDIESLNKSLALVKDNVLSALNDTTDIILFHEQDLEPFKKDILQLPNIIYEQIEFKVPEYYSEELKNSIPEFYPHGTHGKDGPYGEVYHKEHGRYHPGFTMGYRHMCRWFSGELYNHPRMALYDYYLRLDTDSYIHTKFQYDLFKWAVNIQCKYGFIAPGIQIDHHTVIEGLWQASNQWMHETDKSIYIDCTTIPNGKMFYTNFELGYIPWFKESGYMEYYNYLDNTGGFFTKRWGDAPIKYLGINMLMDKKHIQPVTGITYQHGAIYNV